MATTTVPTAVPRLTLREKISYGLGDLGNGFMFDLGQAYLLKFYTDVAGLPAAAAAEIFVITKIFDACVDPMAGAFIDGRTRVGRHGRFRSVMLYSSIALAVLTVFTFLTPGAGGHVDLAYAYVSYMAWGVLYSFTNIPYGSLASVMTQDADQRAQLASFRQAGSVSALLVTGVAFMPIAMALGSERIGYPVAAGAMAVVGVLAFYATFRGTTERVPVRRGEKLTARGFATTIGSNRPLLVLVLMTLFSISAYNTKTAMIAYFTQYVLGSIALLPYVNLISIGSSVFGILAIPVLTRRIGKKNTALLGFAVAAVADGLNFVLPVNAVVFTLLLSVSFVGVALPNGITWALVGDVIDYGHWRTGVRREGITYSVFNFSRKLAQSIAGGIAGFGLSAIGYVANAEQTASVQLGIKGLQALFPCAAFALAAVVLFLLYPLSDRRLGEMVAEVHEREADGAVGA